MIALEVFYRFVGLLTQILTFAIFIRAIMSWFPMRPDNPLIIIMNQITEPVLGPLRRVVPMIGMIDITPLVAILLLQLIGGLVPQF